jgi:hypothetical protein
MGSKGPGDRLWRSQLYGTRETIWRGTEGFIRSVWKGRGWPAVWSRRTIRVESVFSPGTVSVRGTDSGDATSPVERFSSCQRVRGTASADRNGIFNLRPWEEADRDHSGRSRRCASGCRIAFNSNRPRPGRLLPRRPPRPQFRHRRPPRLRHQLNPLLPNTPRSAHSRFLILDLSSMDSPEQFHAKFLNHLA